LGRATDSERDPASGGFSRGAVEVGSDVGKRDDGDGGVVRQRRVGEAPRLLLYAARRLEGHDTHMARETYRDAFAGACFAGRLAGDTGLPAVAAAIRSAPASSDPPSVTDRLLDAAARLVDAGYPAAAAEARRALGAFRDEPMSSEVRLRWLWLACRMSIDLWDDEAWDALSTQLLELVRDGGMLALFPQGTRQRIAWDLFAGNLATASARLVEHDAVLEAIGGELLSTSRIAVAAFRGDEAEIADLAETTTRVAVARGEGQWIAVLNWATAVLYNGLGRYDKALLAAQQGVAYPADMSVSHWTLSELVEAAVRSGRPVAAEEALERLAEMARACDSDWVLGVHARARALVAEPANAEKLYLRALEHLQRTSFRTEVARAHLVYGEWVRRQGRRADARVQLRAAHDLFSSIGMEAFAERARTELLATGERVRRRTADTRDDLTPQERQIAQLARGGLSNTEIGARLFLSPRTVEWHLRNVYGKLGIQSRRELKQAREL
jgi:DNA-binding CsgD family transcriptional regulator/tetratricopeptide (TPR) repeat protein